MHEVSCSCLTVTWLYAKCSCGRLLTPITNNKPVHVTNIERFICPLGNTALYHTVLLLACWGRHNLFPALSSNLCLLSACADMRFYHTSTSGIKPLSQPLFSPSATRPADYNQWLDKLRWNAESISILTKLVAAHVTHTAAFVELWS